MGESYLHIWMLLKHRARLQDELGQIAALRSRPPCDQNGYWRRPLWELIEMLLPAVNASERSSCEVRLRTVGVAPTRRSVHLSEPRSSRRASNRFDRPIPSAARKSRP